MKIGAELFLTPEQKQWFVHDRFGMFIHWGLYALPARHEWVKTREEIADADYQRYFEHFDPDLYDPADWARRARRAGMRYVVLTSKHHEGFCLWDSQATDYKVTNTPYGRDVLRSFVDAFRAEGLKIGFYYSLLDWHHPDFPIDVHHPQRNHPEVARLNAGRDITRYAAYMREQVTELLTGYGRIDIIWFDFSYPRLAYGELPGKGRDDWQSDRLMALARRLQPGIIINNRLDIADIAEGMPDVVTPEQYTPREAPTLAGKPVVWEVCHTLSGSWGYHRDEQTWKSPEQLVQLLVDSVALGGNLLMNVGPTGRGNLDPRAVRALAAYEAWMQLNERSIVGCGAAEFVAPSGCRMTQNGDRLYLHICDWPFRHIHCEGLAGRIAYAQFLHDASEIAWLEPQPSAESNLHFEIPPGMVTFELPVNKPDTVVPVIEIFLR